jgi:hypothetical protein
MPLDVAPTADPLPRFLALRRRFGGGRVINLAAVGFHWRLHYAHLGEGGIAFPDPAQEERYNGLSDEERSQFTEKLRALVDAADLERIQSQNRQRRFHAGMQLATMPTAAHRAMPRVRCQPRSRTREHSSRRTRAAGTSRRGPPSRSTDDPEPEPPLGGLALDHFRLDLSAGERCAAFLGLPEDVQQPYWDELSQRIAEGRL